MANQLVSASALPMRRMLVIPASIIAIGVLAVPASAQQPAPAQPPAAQPPAKAQQPAPKAKAQPKGAQAQPPAQAQGQPPAQQSAAAPELPPLVFSPWTKLCPKGQDANAKQVCVTGKDAKLESGQPIVSVVLLEPEGDKKLLRATVPLTMLLKPGTRVVVDQNEQQAMQAPYSICFINGCMADFEVNADVVDRMKKGQTLFVQAVQANGQVVTFNLPLADFAKVYDGPPTDPKVYEEQQKKLQEELQRRAEEARKKLETPGAKK